MKVIKYFLFLVLLCGCKEVKPPQSQTIWHENKKWAIVDRRAPITQEEIKKASVTLYAFPHDYSKIIYDVCVIVCGEETKTIYVI